MAEGMNITTALPNSGGSIARSVGNNSAAKGSSSNDFEMGSKPAHDTEVFSAGTDDRKVSVQSTETREQADTLLTVVKQKGIDGGFSWLAYGDIDDQTNSEEDVPTDEKTDKQDHEEKQDPLREKLDKESAVPESEEKPESGGKDKTEQKEMPKEFTDKLNELEAKNELMAQEIKMLQERMQKYETILLQTVEMLLAYIAAEQRKRAEKGEEESAILAALKAMLMTVVREIVGTDTDREKADAKLAA